MNQLFIRNLPLIFLSIPIFAQTTLTGSIRDGAGKPLPFANVVLLNARDSSLVKGSVGTETGSYEFVNIKAGQYVLSASLLGYKSGRSAAIEVGTSRVEVPALTLSETVKNLSEVQVTAQKPLFEQQTDRMVINVQSSITTSGGTALDVLERSPGIAVNRQNNTIAMNGKDGVMVMLNGKLTRLPMTAVVQMLSGMNAGNIEKIELITTPPASFDAEGNAGLINIVTKKNVNLGTNGSYSANFADNHYERIGTSLTLNHRSEKLSIYSDYSGTMNHFRSYTYNDRTISLPGNELRNTYVGERLWRNWSHNGRVGLDYTVNAKTAIGGLLSAFSTRQNQLANNVTNLDQAQVPTTKINIEDRETNHWWNYAANANIRHKVTDRQEVSVDLDYLYYYNRDPHKYRFTYEYLLENRQQLDQLINSKQTPLRLWVTRADYTRTFASGLKLETGIKGTFTRLNNKVVAQRFTTDSWVIDPEFSQNVFMTETIGAAYVNMSKSFTARTKVQAGLRYEHTVTDLNTVTNQNLLYRNYGGWFPSVSFSQDLTKQSSIQFSYSRRITRPTFNDLAPFFTLFDPNTSLTGNIRLLPAYSNTFQSSYRFKKDFALTFGYTDTRNSIIWNIKVQTDQNKQYITPDNIGRIRNYSLALNFPYQVSSWWKMQTSLQGIRQAANTVLDGVQYDRATQYMRFNGSQTFQLSNNFTAEVSGFYQTSSLFGVMLLKPIGALNVGLQKTLNNNKGTFRLAGEDILWTQKIRVGTSNPSVGYDVSLRFVNYSRMVRVTYSRNFGSQSVKAANRRATGSDEERSRVQSN